MIKKPYSSPKVENLLVEAIARMKALEKRMDSLDDSRNHRKVSKFNPKNPLAHIDSLNREITILNTKADMLESYFKAKVRLGRLLDPKYKPDNPEPAA